GAQLLPRPKLPGQEGPGEDTPDKQGDSDVVWSTPMRGNPRPLHRDAAHDQRTRVQPQQPRFGQGLPVREPPPCVVSADDDRKQDRDHAHKYPQAELCLGQGQSTGEGSAAVASPTAVTAST